MKNHKIKNVLLSLLLSAVLLFTSCIYSIDALASGSAGTAAVSAENEVSSKESALQSTASPDSAAADSTAVPKDSGTSSVKAAAENLVDWEKAQNGNSKNDPLISESLLNNAGSSSSDWTVIGARQLGLSEDYASYLSALTAYIAKTYPDSASFSKASATELARIAITVCACGGNPDSLTGDNGKKISFYSDALAGSSAESLSSQGINALIFTLIAMDAAGTKPSDSSSVTYDEVIKALLSLQLPDGGFTYEGETADPDITAMAITALAPSYESDADVKAAADRAVSALSGLQLADGGFASYGNECSESASQAIIALCSLSIDPANDSRFVKNGTSVLDALLSYAGEDGGFLHSKEDGSASGSNALAGEQAFLALDAVLLLQNGSGRLYGFSTPLPSYGGSSGNGQGAVPIIAITAAAALVLFIFLLIFLKRGKNKKDSRK